MGDGVDAMVDSHEDRLQRAEGNLSDVAQDVSGLTSQMTHLEKRMEEGHKTLNGKMDALIVVMQEHAKSNKDYQEKTTKSNQDYQEKTLVRLESLEKTRMTSDTIVAMGKKLIWPLVIILTVGFTRFAEHVWAALLK
ncbi:hypothetical protein UFOVP75_61 [uncultured Caudovirales phage]|uniref:Uncharacterized protein n=1 Tax=uncultured Caudovirales phage TaxID=2100421 RepID=A0A6J5L0M2_9CAUD|nr:hypothetical protein UFOVP75_61 [uncultured Caudovirales phage]